MNERKSVSFNGFSRNSLRNVILCILLSIPALLSYAANPLVTSVFTADPSGFVGGDGKMYVICSHDQAGATSYDQLYDYILLSSSDLVNWQNHGVVFNARTNTTWANLAYAPDMLVRNGKYYLYFPNGASSIGVATSNSPTGPFVDALGKPLITGSTPGVSGVQWVFDPGVFVDDDGTGYIYFGGGGPGNARVIKLGSDYISVSGSAVTINAPRFFEASYMHKRNGIYYFSYSSDFSQGAATIEYMTSSNPMTGFQHRGTVLPNPWSNLGNNNHHSIVEYKGQSYIFYHNRAVSNAVYQRSACIDRLYYNADGTIQQVNPSQAGVPAVTSGPTATRTSTISATPTPIVNGNISVMAKGTLGGENLELRINGTAIASWTMTTTFQSYVANGNGPIEAYFTNDDGVANGMDIQLDYLIYNGKTYQAEEQETNTAVYQNSACGGSFSEMLQCNGYILFPVSSEPTPTPTATGTLTPTPKPTTGTGLVNFDQLSYSVAPGAQFTTKIVAATSVGVASYGIAVEYNPAVMTLVSVTDNGFGMDPIYNDINNAVTMAGFRAAVTSNNGIATLTWKASSTNGASGMISIKINNLSDANYNELGKNGGTSSVTIGSTSIHGDVNGDGIVNIVDALIIAQKSVGLEPPIQGNPDVNCDGVITIVDALIVAQFSVGLITSIAC